MRRWYIVLLLTALLAFGSSTVVLSSDDVASEAADSAPTKEMRSTGERFTFQAEVNRLMDIIIHSLYSNKDIYLRELISNASDALDKIRTLALSDSKLLGEGSAANLEMRIEVDRANNILKIRDRGIGMTKDELVKNLGTIAKSGTSSFLEKMQQGGDMNLIGQFGVGFYSVYLVSDYVEVISKSNDGPQHIWESQAGGAFVVTEDEGGAVSGEGDLERGTMIRIHLKPESLEYIQEERLRELVRKYSEFINFPIYLLSEKEVEVEDPVEEDSADDSGISDDDSDSSASEAKPKRTEIVPQWDLLNGQKAIWLRPAKDVEPEEYNSFYAALSKEDGATPMAHAHFSAEGDVEFRSILYVPDKAPFDFYDNYYQRKSPVRLYVRRVFISDSFDDLLPRYLSFLLGLVDSDTLPLNVSREMLQQHSSLKTIKKKLVRKALDMIKSVAEKAQAARKRLLKEDSKGDGAEAAAADADDDDEAPFDREVLEADAKKYETLWTEFGKALKLGIMEDGNNRNRLSKLLRVRTTKSGGELVPLSDYVERMQDGQDGIYYVCGSSVEEVERSPYLERLKEHDLEVVLFTEPMDEYMMQNLLDYDDKAFHNVAKDEIKLSTDDHDKKVLQKTKEVYKPLTKWWRELLGKKSGVESVKVSSRLSSTPCVVVASKYGWSANMQRIMAAQALGDGQMQAVLAGLKTLEINPRHPLIVRLLQQVEADSEDPAAAETATLLFETALLESGYPVSNQQQFADKVYQLMKSQSGMERSLSDLHPEIEWTAEDEAKASADASASSTPADAPADGMHDEL